MLRHYITRKRTSASFERDRLYLLEFLVFVGLGVAAGFWADSHDSSWKTAAAWGVASLLALKVPQKWATVAEEDDAARWLEEFSDFVDRCLATGGWVFALTFAFLRHDYVVGTVLVAAPIGLLLALLLAVDNISGAPTAVPGSSPGSAHP